MEFFEQKAKAVDEMCHRLEASQIKEEKFGQDKYRTKLGFGLHWGWSVEGPVGSPTKIDWFSLPLTTAETTAVETPAASAIWRMVGRD